MTVKIWGLDDSVKKELRERLQGYPEDPDKTLEEARKDFLNRLPEELRSEYSALAGYANIVMSIHEYEAYQCANSSKTSSSLKRT